ncbi:hypothetical protein FRC09_012046 [Ceratobasidium sp. 395]|nr:hypothetical protein FRC09_012046 [Ceratobasidium sp. 395]
MRTNSIWKARAREAGSGSRPQAAFVAVGLPRDRQGDGRGCGGRGAVLLADHDLEVAEVLGLDVEDPLKVVAHLALHLVDLTQRKRALANDTSGLVRVTLEAIMNAEM